MGTARITGAHIESYAHNNILTYVDSRVYVKDPRSPNSTVSTRQFVYDSDPFMKGINFSDLPYIIVEFPILNYSNVSADGRIKSVTWTQKIIIRTARDGSANTRSDVGRSDMLSICDDLNEMFNNETVKQELRDLNIYKINLTKDDVDTIAISQKEIYESSYTLEYETRMSTG